MTNSTATVEDEHEDERAGAESEGTSDSHGTTMAAITRRFVSLIKEHYGKGPTSARTYHVDDVVVVLLGGGYTAVERTLLADGQEEVVHAQREAFQEAMRPRFKRVIEEEMRREVVAFMSTVHSDPDYNAELFVLASQDS
jgi:uncharacterized protein YbcI